MHQTIVSAKDPNVLGVISLFRLGDYFYTAGIIVGIGPREQILAMGRQPIDAKSKAEFEVVPPEEFPKEVTSVAVSAFPNIRSALAGENRELVSQYIRPHLWGK